MIITLEGVQKTYPLAKKSVGDLNFHIQPQEIIGLLGLNGSGKTTTLKLLAQYLKPTRGQITMGAAQQQTGIVPSQRTLRGPENVVMQSETLGFSDHLSPQGLMPLLAGLFHNFLPETFQDKLQRLQVPEKPARFMSKGQQQRLRVAMALARKGSLYLFDEPLAGIDIVSREVIMETIRQLDVSQCAVVIATHEIKEVEPLLTRMLVLQEGELVQDVSKAALKESHQTFFDLFMATCSVGVPTAPAQAHSPVPS